MKTLYVVGMSAIAGIAGRRGPRPTAFATNVLPVIRSILSHGSVGMVSIAAQLNE
jgi:hypothetical protein